MQEVLSCKCGADIPETGATVACLQCDSSMCFRCVIEAPDGLDLCQECVKSSLERVKQPCDGCKSREWVELKECPVRDTLPWGKHLADWYCEKCIYTHRPCFNCTGCDAAAIMACSACRKLLCADHYDRHLKECVMNHQCKRCSQVTVYRNLEVYLRAICNRCNIPYCMHCSEQVTIPGCRITWCNSEQCSNQIKQHQISGECLGIRRCRQHPDQVYSLVEEVDPDFALNMCWFQGCAQIACRKCVPNYVPDHKWNVPVCWKHQEVMVHKLACPCCLRRYGRGKFGDDGRLILYQIMGTVVTVHICMPCFLPIREWVNCVLLTKALPRVLMEKVLFYTTLKQAPRVKRKAQW